MTTTTANAKFDRILDLEHDVRVCTAQLAFARNFGETDRATTKRQRARTKLYAAIEALSAEELAAFGPYRAQATRPLD